MNEYKVHLAVLFLFYGLTACTDPNRGFTVIWQNTFQKLGTNSSIKCADLNRDGVLDVVLGAGKNEFESCDTAVIALDGKTGRVLWAVGAKDQVVGSANFLDITQDQIPDVVIGGRSAQLMAIDGNNGQVIWTFQTEAGISQARDYMRFNFYNTQTVDDYDNDGLGDLLVTNGGNVYAYPNSTQDRYAGVLAIISSANGQVIALDTMPDGKETYMTPLYHRFQNQEEASVIFGSGGETIGGSLFIVPVSDLLQQDISPATVLYTDSLQGFVGPPILVDVTGDTCRDILANSHNGRIIAIDGKSHEVIWERKFANFEANTSPVPGYFNGDKVPDIFLSLSKGTWPKNTGQSQFVLDGKNGEVLHMYDLGCMGFSNPISYDVDADGGDELIWSVNDFNCEGIYLGDGSHSFYLADPGENTGKIWGPKLWGKNIATTPWLGDVDQNGRLDIMYCVQANTNVKDKYFGFSLIRLSTAFTSGLPPGWTEYLGPKGRGVFPAE